MDESCILNQKFQRCMRFRVDFDLKCHVCTLGGFQYTYSGLLSISSLTCDARACVSHKTTVIYVAVEKKVKILVKLQTKVER